MRVYREIDPERRLLPRPVRLLYEQPSHEWTVVL